MRLDERQGVVCVKVVRERVEREFRSLGLGEGQVTP